MCQISSKWKVKVHKSKELKWHKMCNNCLQIFKDTWNFMLSFMLAGYIDEIVSSDLCIPSQNFLIPVWNILIFQIHSSAT